MCEPGLADAVGTTEAAHTDWGRGKQPLLQGAKLAFPPEHRNRRALRKQEFRQARALWPCRIASFQADPAGFDFRPFRNGASVSDPVTAVGWDNAWQIFHGPPSAFAMTASQFHEPLSRYRKMWR